MKYVVLGSSAAGINGVKEIRRNDPKGEIILISKDMYPYSRCILHHYLGGERTKEQISFVEKDFEKIYNVTYIKEKECISLNTDKQQVILEDNERVSYDKLLIATGASSLLPSIKGLNGTNNVIGFRNIDDIEFLKKKYSQSHNIVILGAGLVGVDALSGLLHAGKKSTLIETSNRLLSRQLDKRAASAYENAFEEKGCSLLFNRGIQEIISDESNNIKEIIMSDGDVIPCDLLIVAAGVKANTSFLSGTKVKTDNLGLIIDFSCRTNIENIYGAGDVTGRSAIWSVAVKEGINAGLNMTGNKSKMQDFFDSKSTMNFEGIPSMSLGINEPVDESFNVEIVDDGKNYKKIIHKDGKIYGAILQGDLDYSGILTHLIEHKIDVSKVKKPLFNIDYSDFFQVSKNFEFYYDE